MRKRTVALLLALGVAGAGAGFGGGLLMRPEPVVRPVATPLRAASPSVPMETERPYKPDIAFPSLQPGLTYQTEELGRGQFVWQYVVPVGWRSGSLAPDELTWSVPDNPKGSYGMRVELVVSDHRPAPDHVERKLQDILDSPAYSDVQVLEQTENTLAITYRSSEGWKRHNSYRWFTAPGVDNAGLEFSVNGRAQDVPGLKDLFATVTASVEQR